MRTLPVVGNQKRIQRILDFLCTELVCRASDNFGNAFKCNHMEALFYKDFIIPQHKYSRGGLKVTELDIKI